MVCTATLYSAYVPLDMGLKMTNIQFFLHLVRRRGRASMKGQRYFAEIHLSRGVLVPINRENQGVTVIQLLRTLYVCCGFNSTSGVWPRAHCYQVNHTSETAKARNFNLPFPNEKAGLRCEQQITNTTIQLPQYSIR